MLPSENLFYKMLGEIIQKKRRDIGLSQDELASSIGLVRTSITNIEAGRQKVHIYTLYRIAAQLDTPVMDLLPNLESSSEDLSQLLNKQNILTDTGETVGLKQEEKEKVLKMMKKK